MHLSSVRARALAPSNIAIVKYMGKKSLPGNIPENPSVSLTLDSLCTFVELIRGPGANFYFDRDSTPFSSNLPLNSPSLDDKSLAKIWQQIQRIHAAAPDLLKRFGVTTSTFSGASFRLKSANTFPAASGIASSASAFAAITLGVALTHAHSREAFEQAWSAEPELRRVLAALSREGSGSSCRSMEGPWVHWSDARATAVPSFLTDLSHFVLLISEEAKSVSSSQAHSRIKTSPLWTGRVERTTERSDALLSALKNDSTEAALKELSRIAWQEAWEMHSLFHTSTPPFSYWKPATIEILQWLTPFVESDKTPPVVTLDAGPNIHLIVDRKDEQKWIQQITSRFPGLKFLQDKPGLGARPLALEIGEFL